MARETDILVRVGIQDNTGKVLKDLQSRIIRFVGAVTASIAAIKVVSFPIAEAAAFEKELKNVQKTTGFTNRDIEQLSGSLLDMSRQLGISGTELAQISAIAGQLGLGAQGRDAVLAFTEAVAEGSVALGDTVEKTAEYSAQLSNIFKIPIDRIRVITSVLNEVSNNSVATAAQLADIGKRIGDTAGLAFTQTTALAGYVRELGVPVEQAGTGIVNTFVNLQTKTSQVLDLLKTDTKSWSDLLKSDPIEALKAVAKEIYNIESQSDQAEVIKKLFGTGRQFALAQKIVADAGNEFVKLTELLKLANEESEKGTSATKEYENIMQALTGQVDLLSASFKALITEAGTGAIDPLVASTQELIQALNSPAAKDFVEGAALALSDLVSSVTTAITALTEMETTFEEVARAVEAVGKAIAVVFIGKIGASLVKRILRLSKFIVAFGAGVRKAFTFRNAGPLLNVFGLTQAAATKTSAAMGGMQAATTSGLVSLEAYAAKIHVLFSKLILQVEALSIRLGVLPAQVATAAASLTAVGLGAGGAAVAAAGSAAGVAASNAAYQAAQARAAAAKAAAGAQASAVKATGAIGKIAAAVGALWAGIKIGFSGLLKIVRGFFFGPWGIAFSIGIGIVTSFWDEFKYLFNLARRYIGDFFGWWQGAATDNTAAIERANARLLKDQEKVFADYESATSKFIQFTQKVGKTVGDIFGDADIRGSTEATETAFDNLYTKVAYVGGVFARADEAVNKASVKLQNLALDADYARANIEDLEKQQRNLKLLALTASATGNEDDEALILKRLEDTSQAIANQKADLAVIEERALAAAKSLGIFVKDLEGVREALRNETFIKNLGNLYDQEDLGIAKLVLDFKKAEKAVEELQKKYDTLKKSITAAAKTGKDQKPEDIFELEKLSGQLTVAKNALREQDTTLQAVGDKYKTIVGAADKWNRFNNLSQESLSDLVAGLDKANFEGILSASGSVARAFRESEVSVKALAEYGLLSRLNDSIQDTAKSMEHFEKVAKAALDNTFNEISSLQQGFIDFKNELIFDKIDFKFDAQIDDAGVRKIEDQFDDIRDRTEKKFKLILKTAVPSQVKYWEARKKAALDALDAEESSLVADKKKQALQGKLLALQKETQKFFDKAASATNVDEYLSLKGAGKDGLRAIQGVIKEMQSLERIDLLGNTKNVFADFEIDKYVSQLGEQTQKSQDSIAEGNKRISENATRVKDEFTAATQKITEAFTQTDNIVKGLRKVFPDIDRVIANLNTVKLPEELAAINYELQDTLAQINAISLRGGDLDFDAEAFTSRLAEARRAFQTELTTQAQFELGEQSTTPTIAPLTAKQVADSLTNGFDEFNKNPVKLEAEIDTNYIRKATEEDLTKEPFKAYVDPDGNYFRRAIEEETKNDPPTVSVFSEVNVDEMGKLIEDETKNNPIEVATTTDTDALRNSIQAETENNPVTVQADVSVNSESLVSSAKEAADAADPVKLKATAIITEFSVTAEAISKFLLKIPEVNIKNNARGGPIQSNAAGGKITGPGTGTSDSILSWLSNGEFVIDAFTTRFFGSSFFSNLQLFARSGRKPKIPAFAAGGPVGAAAAAGGRDVVDVNLNLGGNKYSLFGERQQVRALTSALRQADQGA